MIAAMRAERPTKSTMKQSKEIELNFYKNDF
jgi:hypothetical protein